LDIKVLGNEGGNGDVCIKKRFVDKFNEKTDPQWLHNFWEDNEYKQTGHDPFTICNEIIISGDECGCCGCGHDWTITFCCGGGGGFCWGSYKLLVCSCGLLGTIEFCCGGNGCGGGFCRNVFFKNQFIYPVFDF
jgi:hypothetical protein